MPVTANPPATGGVLPRRPHTRPMPNRCRIISPTDSGLASAAQSPDGAGSLESTDDARSASCADDVLARSASIACGLPFDPFLDSTLCGAVRPNGYSSCARPVNTVQILLDFRLCPCVFAQPARGGLRLNSKFHVVAVLRRVMQGSACPAGDSWIAEVSGSSWLRRSSRGSGGWLTEPCWRLGSR